MPFILRRDFEQLVQKQVIETGLSEKIVRQEMESVARINGYQIEEPDTLSLVNQIERLRMTLAENTVVQNLRNKGL